MKRMNRQVSVLVVIVLVFTFVAPVYAQAVSLGGQELSTKGAIVMDVETGLTLFSYNEDTRRAPASMIKILTIYVVLDALKAGEVKPDDPIEINTAISEFSYDKAWSNVPLPEGMSVTIGELIEVVMVRSACAATVALSQAVCKTEAAMITRMKNKATSMDVETIIKDTWGGSPDNRISPRGLAIITRGLLTDYPEILEITSKKTITFKGISYGTSNLLLGVYQGLDGLKTGYTNPAGYCFTGTAVRGGRRLIAITMGSSLESRYPDIRAMLDYGFTVVEGAKPSSANLIVDGIEMPLTAYLINDYHYFKLRDVAFLLKDSGKQFGVVSWDQESSTAILESGAHYEPDEKDLQAVASFRPYNTTNTKIFYDGELCDFEIYMIDDNNYFRLRDLAYMIDFSAVWLDETRTVLIDTAQGYVEN